jgi:hypothetical protein
VACEHEVSDGPEYASADRDKPPHSCRIPPEIAGSVAVAHEAMIQYDAWWHNLRQFVALTRRSGGTPWLAEGGPGPLPRTVESHRAVNGLRVSLEVCASVIRAARADASHGAGVIEGTLDRVDRDRCAEPVAFAWRCLEILRRNLTDCTMGTTRIVPTASGAGGKRPAPVAPSVEGAIALIDSVTEHLADLEMDLRDLHHRKRTMRGASELDQPGRSPAGHEA